MTDKEKAKAYNEAIEKSKDFYTQCKKVGAKETVDFLENIFPELKESKDERIRKALIKLVEMVDKNPIGQMFGYGDITYSDMLDWLYKQGKNIDEYEDKLDRCACESFDKGYKAALENQGEQKPTLPTWCEEDEQMLQRANSAFEYACFDSKSMILWLKSLKERLKGE